MKYNEWFVTETKRLMDIVSVELKEAEINIRTLEFKRKRLLNRINELEFILAEIYTRREQSLRIQKPTCWAMTIE